MHIGYLDIAQKLFREDSRAKDYGNILKYQDEAYDVMNNDE